MDHFTSNKPLFELPKLFSLEGKELTPEALEQLSATTAGCAGGGCCNGATDAVD